MGAGSSHAVNTADGAHVVQHIAVEIVRLKESIPDELATPWNKILLKGPFIQKNLTRVWDAFVEHAERIGPTGTGSSGGKQAAGHQGDAQPPQLSIAQPVQLVLPYTSLHAVLCAAVWPKPGTCPPSTSAELTALVATVFGAAALWPSGLTWPHTLGCLCLAFLEGVLPPGPAGTVVMVAGSPSTAGMPGASSSLSPRGGPVALARAPSWRSDWGKAPYAAHASPEGGHGGLVRQHSGVLHSTAGRRGSGTGPGGSFTLGTAGVGGGGSSFYGPPGVLNTNSSSSTTGGSSVMEGGGSGTDMGPLGSFAGLAKPTWSEEQARELEGDSAGAADLAREAALKLHARAVEGAADHGHGHEHGHAVPPLPLSQGSHVKPSIMKQPSFKRESARGGAGVVGFRTPEGVSQHEEEEEEGHRVNGSNGSGLPPLPVGRPTSAPGAPGGMGPRAPSTAGSSSEGGPTTPVPQNGSSAQSPPPHLHRIADADVAALAAVFHLALEAYMQLDAKKVGHLELSDLRSSMAQVVLHSPSQCASSTGASHLEDMSAAMGTSAAYGGAGVRSEHGHGHGHGGSERTPLEGLAEDRFAELTGQHAQIMGMGEESKGGHTSARSTGSTGSKGGRRSSLASGIGALFTRKQQPASGGHGTVGAGTGAQPQPRAPAEEGGGGHEGMVTFVDFLGAFSTWFGVPDEDELAEALQG